MQRSALCRSRQELSNEYLLAKFGFDTAENETYYFVSSSSREFEFELRNFEPLICNPEDLGRFAVSGERKEQRADQNDASSGEVAPRQGVSEEDNTRQNEEHSVESPEHREREGARQPHEAVLRESEQENADRRPHRDRD